MILRDKIFNFFSKDLDTFELNILLKDLEESGGKRTGELIRKRLRQMKREQQKICVTCGKVLEPEDHKYTLLIGPDNFLKRASFCAIDCLDYFLKHLDGIDYDGKNKIEIEKTHRDIHAPVDEDVE